jgi:hypothetical protein
MRNALLGAVAIAIAVLLAECALRVLGMYSPPDWPPRLVAAGFYKADPATGYRLYPSTRTCQRYPEEGGAVFEIRSNSDGFRSDHEFAPADPRRRIAVVGDSFVFGLGVEAPERLTDVLGSQLPDWRVDNLGMSGWGASEMVRAIEALGPKLRPEAVVIAMYTHDFVRLGPQYMGMGYPIPRFSLRGGALRETPFQPPIGWRRLRLWQARLDLEARVDPDFLALNEALFERFRTSVTARAAKPIALFLPGPADTRRDRARRERMRAWAERTAVPFADLTEPMAAARRDAAVTLPNNAHWNARGHRIAAGLLRELLASAGVVAAQKPAETPPGAPAPSQRAWSYCHDAEIEGPEAPSGGSAPLPPPSG